VTARRASRTKLLAGAGHELRTPLNAITGMTSLLLETNLDDEQRGYASTLRAASAVLAATIDDVVDWARLDSGSLELFDEPFAPAQILRECIAVLAAPRAANRCVFVAHVDESTPGLVSGDGPRVRRVVLHALESVARRGARGETPVRVAARRLADGRCELRFVVGSTNGTDSPKPGGAESFHEAVSRAICARMDGRFDVGDDARGAPRVEVVVAVREASTADPSPPFRAESGLRVLVVEDDPIHCEVAVRTLERLGFRPDTAKDGHEAVSAVVRTDYDVLLMDLQLPGIGGLEVARGVRRRRPMGRPFMIAMTAGASVADRTACLDAGLDACVAKPVDAAVLTEVLSGVSAPVRAARPSAAGLIDERVIESLRTLGKSVRDATLPSRLTEMYLEDAPATVAKLRDCVAHGDGDGLAVAAHHLHGTSAAAGASAMADLAVETDRAFRAGGAVAAREILARFDDVWPRTRDALHAAIG
jgi:CheY-like chemotaxis protein